ncbi:MAG TPA: hypothetical protein VF306_23495, partial [Pirellulales bacterium]
SLVDRYDGGTFRARDRISGIRIRNPDFARTARTANPPNVGLQVIVARTGHHDSHRGGSWRFHILDGDGDRRKPIAGIRCPPPSKAKATEKDGPRVQLANLCWNIADGVDLS